MNIDFTLAPWRAYKGWLAAVAVLAPILYYLGWSSLAVNGSDGFIAVVVARWSVPWFAGWFLILFGDGQFGGLYPQSLRAYYAILGVLVLILPSVRAWAYYDRDAIRSRAIVQNLTEDKKASLRALLAADFALASVPREREYDFYAMLDAFRPYRLDDAHVSRVEFTARGAGILWVEPRNTDANKYRVYLLKGAGRWSVDKISMKG